MEFFGNATLENKDTFSHVYILMNKPSGYVCSYVSDSHKTVYQLLSEPLQKLMKNPRGKKLHTVGRLDCQTSGLLLLTTDGFFSNKLTRPESHVEKVYKANLKNPVFPENQSDYVSRFKNGLILPPERKFPEQKTGPADLVFMNQFECLVTVREGKFHQVRRMFLALQNEVVELQRIKIGDYLLPDDLKEGDYKIL